MSKRAVAAAAREAETTEREQRAFADKVRAVAAAAEQLGARLDAFEQRRARAMIDALLDPEAALEADNLQATLPPPEDEDKMQLETMLERERDDQGDLPAELEVEAPAPSRQLYHS
jgi:hypothetical protein